MKKKQPVSLLFNHYKLSSNLVIRYERRSAKYLNACIQHILRTTKIHLMCESNKFDLTDQKSSRMIVLCNC